jgi:3-dehydroquinate dehydratase / shikimate dehydrogenase
VTYLCVPIFVTDDLAKARNDIDAAVKSGADLVEVRVDTCNDINGFKSLLDDGKWKRPPFIFTCRPEWEGGYSQLDDAKRVALLMSLAPRASDYVDVEMKSAGGPRMLALDSFDQWIVSSHDFSGRPKLLYNLVSELNRLPGDINKIVWTARTIRDNLEAFEILQTKQKPTIALCMGETGLISRVLAKKFGGFLTFASLATNQATAPGQLTIADMKNLYRWDSIGPATKVYGVVAHPVGHSMSPAIHNAAFDATGFDGIYVPLLVEPHYESFKAFMETFVNFQKLDLSGLSITIPHKENALRYLKEKGAEVEPLAERIGAVNTIAIDRQNDSPRLSGTNTDYAAILDSITAVAGIGRDRLNELRIGVIGAGGTGRTAVAALAHYGAEVLVCNRTHDRAVALANEFNGKRGKVSAVALEKFDDCDGWINTSSVGMHPNIGGNPLAHHQPKWSSKTIVFDAVYNPIRTKFLGQAEAVGAKTISGIEMFVRQAAGQFETWTGKTAPKDVMRSVIEKRLQAK